MQSNAAVLYLASLVENSSGEGPFQQARTAQALELSLQQLEQPVALMMAMLTNLIKPDKAAYTAASNQFFKGLKALQSLFLEEGDFLVSSKVTVADVALYSIISTAFRGAISYKRIASLPKVQQWLERVGSQPEVLKAAGVARFLSVPLPLPKET